MKIICFSIFDMSMTSSGSNKFSNSSSKPKQWSQNICKHLQWQDISLFFLFSYKINVQVMYVTITMWSVNNKPCIQTTNLKLLTYKTYATKKKFNTYIFTKHIQTWWKKKQKIQTKK